MMAWVEKLLSEYNLISLIAYFDPKIGIYFLHITV